MEALNQEKRWTGRMKWRVLAAMAFVLATLAGCGSRVKSASEFSSFADKNGLVVIDCTTQMSQYGSIDRMLCAKPANESFQLEFYEFSSKASATEFYEQQYAMIYKDRSDGVQASESNTKACREFEIITETGCVHVVCIGSTCLFVSGSKESIERIQELQDHFGY